MFQAVKLEEIILYLSRGIAPAYAEQGTTVLNQKCIRDHRILLEEARITDPVLKQIPDSKFIQPWDVLVNSTGVGTLGRVAQNKIDSLVATVDGHVTIVRPDLRKVNGAFFGYALISVERLVESMGEGATGQTELSRQRLKEVEVPLPERHIQQKIAAILSAYDDLIENNLRRIKILDEMAQTLYREWFVKFRFPSHQKVKMVNSPLGKIPEGWRVAEFRSIFDIKYGKTLPKTEISEKGLFPVYGAGDVIGYYNKVICQEKCALVTSRGNGSGTVWRTREAAFVTNNSLIIMPKIGFTHWDYSFVELFLKHSNVMEAKTGSAQPQVTIENLNYVKGIVPEQKTVEGFTAFSMPMYDQVDLIFKKNQNLRRTRDLLLPKLISSELDVSELDITIPEANA
jgi:type I restriction enzyme S subunit